MSIGSGKIAQNDNDKKVDEELHECLCNDSDTLENVLIHLGEMGTYQRWLFLSMLPFGFFWAFVYFGQMFITATPNHWCFIPELGHLDLEIRKSLSGAADGIVGHCQMYLTNWSYVLESMTPPDRDTPTEACRHGWDYELSDIPYHTVVSERNWVCDNDGNVPFTQSLAFVGSIVGSLLFGRLADVYGRIPILIASNLLAFIGGLGTIFTNEVWDFAICRFIVGMSCDTCFMMIYILVLEYVGTKHRTWVANMSIALFFGGGCMILPWFAYWIADWRRFTLAITAPMLIVIATPFLIPESTRWLASRRRVDDAVKILRKFERVNKTKIPNDLMEEFIASVKRCTDKNKSVFVVLKFGSMRAAVLLMLIVFLSCAMVFDGLIRLSESFGTDLFITFTISSATELPSIVILVFLLDRWGRRWLTCGPMIISGGLALIAAFVPLGVPSMVVAILSRFFINMSYNAALQWAPEILPTAVRASGASVMHVVGYFGVMVSPYVVYSERVWIALPLVLFGLASMLGGGDCLLLPETKGCPMPQTLEDGERLARTGICGKWSKNNEDVAVDSNSRHGGEIL